jgi:hypothetical protein
MWKFFRFFELGYEKSYLNLTDPFNSSSGDFFGYIFDVFFVDIVVLSVPVLYTVVWYIKNVADHRYLFTGAEEAYQYVTRVKELRLVNIYKKKIVKI